MMWGTGYSMGWAMWLLMGLGTVGFWIVIVLAVRALLPAPRDRRSPSAEDSLVILKERLARGELTVEEYEQRRRLVVDRR